MRGTSVQKGEGGSGRHPENPTDSSFQWERVATEKARVGRRRAGPEGGAFESS